MTDFLKFLSPIALITFVWGIVQYYQKRKYEKKEKRRIEKFNIIKNFHSILNDLKISLINYELENKINLKLLKERTLKLSGIAKNWKQHESEGSDPSTMSNKIIENSSILIEKLDTELSTLSKSLKSNLLELNNISLLGLAIDSKVNEEVLSLFSKIKSTVVQIETEKLESPFNNKIEEILRQIYLIEVLIIKELRQ